jgi:hypothetical protein
MILHVYFPGALPTTNYCNRQSNNEAGQTWQAAAINVHGRHEIPFMMEGQFDVDQFALQSFC